MKMATCHFCNHSFRNRQAVRAHLKSCARYRQLLPKATLPSIGSTPGTVGARDTPPRVGPTWEPVRDASPPRPQTSRSAAGTSQKAPLTALGRWMIQSVKDEVIGKWWSPHHTIPSETKTEALIAIEQALVRLPVDQLPRSELKTIAEGIRDRYYRPVMQAQQRAREDDERKQPPNSGADETHRGGHRAGESRPSSAATPRWVDPAGARAEGETGARAGP